MTYTIYATRQRVPYIIENLKGFAKVVAEDEAMCSIEIEVESSLQLAQLFHAGVMLGLSISYESFDKSPNIFDKDGKTVFDL